MKFFITAFYIIGLVEWVILVYIYEFFYVFFSFVSTLIDYSYTLAYAIIIFILLERLNKVFIFWGNRGILII
jgi:hypothetical protein